MRSGRCQRTKIKPDIKMRSGIKMRLDVIRKSVRFEVELRYYDVRDS